MSSTRGRSFKPRARFLNREWERSRFASHVERLHEDPRSCTVLEVVGFAGAGKTRLLSELRGDIVERHGRKQHLLGISLELERVSTAEGLLFKLRDDLKLDCMLFDTALALFWAESGQRSRIEERRRLAASPVFEALALDANLVQLPLQFALQGWLPARFAVMAFEAAVRAGRKRWRYDKEEFEQIDELRYEPGELQRRLPVYLALDVQRRLASDRSLIAFYDSYEMLTHETLKSNAAWLRSFIDTLDRGLHVIATREPLRWPAEEWKRTIEDLPIGSLPEQEARELLAARVGELQPEIEGHILRASHAIPFFIETLADEYEVVLQRKGHVRVVDLARSPSEAVHKLLTNLPEQQRKLTIAIATVQAFDEGLFSSLSHTLNLGVDEFEFEPFTERFFVEVLSPEGDDTAQRLYKTHELLTTSVRSSPYEQMRRRSLKHATTHLLARCQADGARSHDTLLALFLGVVAGWRTTEVMPLASVEALVDAGYLLYDAGHWDQLASLTDATAATVEDHPVAVACEFLAALAARRVVGVDPALARLEGIVPRAPALGRHARSVELEVAYLRELSGDYASARTAFRALDEGIGKRFDPTDRTHLRTRLWHADMLTMDGELVTAARLLQDAYEALGPRVPLDWAELVRHRGHAFRFSFALERADELYREALESAQCVPALLGKLQTNLAEAACWSQPQQALAEADLAIALNSDLRSRIELAKCEAARAIALAKLEDLPGARAAVSAAVEHATAVGYKAGVAFALQAAAIAEGIAGDRKGLLAAFERLRRAVEELGTYGHLLVAPAWLIDDAAFVEAAYDVEWVQEDQLEERLHMYLRPVP